MLGLRASTQRAWVPFLVPQAMHCGQKKGKVCAGHFGGKEGVRLRKHEEISEVVAVSFLVVIDL